MRRLRIVVRSTRGALPFLVAASIAPAACGSGEDTGSTMPATAGSAGGASGAGGASDTSATGGGGTTLAGTTGIGGSIIGAGGAGGAVDAGAHCRQGVEDVYTVS